MGLDEDKNLACISELLKSLESPVIQQALRVQNYSLDCVNLEQIFITLMRRAEMKSTDPELTSICETIDTDRISTSLDVANSVESLLTATTAVYDSEPGFELLEGQSLFWTHLKTLIYKRFRHSVNNKQFFLAVFILPLTVISMGLGLSLLTPKTEMPTILLTPALYGPNAHSFVE